MTMAPPPIIRLRKIVKNEQLLKPIKNISKSQEIIPNRDYTNTQAKQIVNEQNSTLIQENIVTQPENNDELNNQNVAPQNKLIQMDFESEKIDNVNSDIPESEFNHSDVDVILNDSDEDGPHPNLIDHNSCQSTSTGRNR